MVPMAEWWERLEADGLPREERELERLKRLERLEVLRLLRRQRAWSPCRVGGGKFWRLDSVKVLVLRSVKWKTMDPIQASRRWSYSMDTTASAPLNPKKSKVTVVGPMSFGCCTAMAFPKSCNWRLSDSRVLSLARLKILSWAATKLNRTILDQGKAALWYLVSCLFILQQSSPVATCPVALAPPNKDIYAHNLYI